MEHLLNSGELLRYVLFLNYLLTVLWWKLAVTESEGTTKTRFRNGPHCSCSMCNNHRNGCTITRGNVSTVILPLRDNWKCYRRRRVLHTVHYSDHQMVTPLLLILAGDVETNPGPGSIDADNTTILDLEDIRDVMDELRDVLACYYGIGEMLRLPNNKLEETCGQNLSAADAMRKVITEWLKRNYNSSRFRPPTWKALVDAVEHPAGGNNKAEAEKIALRHKKELEMSINMRAMKRSRKESHSKNIITSYKKKRVNKSDDELEMDTNIRPMKRPREKSHTENQEKGVHKTDDEIDNVTIDVKTLSSELSAVQSKWYEMGIQLGITKDKLDTFNEDHGKVARCFLATLNYWVDGNTDVPVSWESIIKVLNDPFVNEPAMSNRLRGKYCVETPKKDRHTPAGSCDTQDDENISSSETCYLPQEKVDRLTRPTEQSQGALNWLPKQSCLARVKKKTEDLKWKFNILLHDFRATLSETTNDENFFRRCDLILDILSIDSKTGDEIKASNDVKKLSEKIFKHQSFMNFGILVEKLIPLFGSEQDKVMAKEYIETFKTYLKCRVIDCSEMCPSVLTNHFSIIFIVNENQEEYRISDLFTFRLHLSEYIGIDDTKILLAGVKGGSVIVHVLLPDSFLKKLLSRPLYPKKIEAFKDASVRSYHWKDHEVLLKHWKTLTNVSLPPAESSPIHEKKGKIIKSAHHQGEECMALVYPNQFSKESEVDIEYIKYLEVLIRDHKEVPSIRGLYYPPEEGELQRYPVVITEKLKFLEEITIPTNYDESDIDLLQISLLSNIASCAKGFEKLNHKMKVSTDHILIQEDAAEYKAKFIPVYGDSLISEIHSNSISKSLPQDDLLWIKEIVLHIVSHGGSTSHVEIPDKHILKNMIEQKWLSEDTQFRPHTYSELADELQHLLETEKTWIGLIKISTDDDLVMDEVQIHVILIGHTGVGKTSLRKHLKNDPIDINERPTIVMEPEFLYCESMEGSVFKPLLDLPSDCQTKVFLTMWDTGGQPIFQDLLPCFARLKCMYGIVFRLSDLEKFDERPEIRPCTSSHKPASSPFTNRDIMYRNLSFVQVFSQRQQEILPPEVRSEDSQEALTAAVMIGTFRDKATPSDRHILKDIDLNIGQFASENKSSISLYAVQEQGEYKSYVHKVDNTRSGNESDKGSDSGIELLRNAISTCAKESSSTKIPRSWQQFRLALQRKCYTNFINIGILPLDEVILIGKECNVKNPKAALMYFHELGVFMWYHSSKKRTLKNFVVIDPKNLLQILGTLFCYDPKSLTTEWGTLTKKGVVPMSLYRCCLEKKGCKIDENWFMDFLEEHHLCIRVCFPSKEICYFIPSVMPTVDDYERNLKRLNNDDISPLYIVPDPKSKYIATGVFARLLTALAGVTYGNTRWKIPLDSSIQYIQFCRNQFEFIINDCMHVVLSEFSQYIRVDCIPYDDILMNKDIYFHIRSTLNVQLQRVVPPRWSKEQEFDLTVACNSCSLKETHFLKVKKIDLVSNTCECTNGYASELKKSDRRWFNNEDIPEMTTGEADTLFYEAMKNGSLNISVASVVFFGISSSEVSSAKHITLQEHVPTTMNTAMSSLGKHEIYFRAADCNDTMFKKMETNDYNEIITFTMSSKAERKVETKHVSSSAQVQVSSPTFPSQQSSASSLESPRDQILSAQQMDASISTVEETAEETKPKQDLPHQESSPKQDLPKLEASLDQSLVAMSVADTIHFMTQYKNTGKMELLHVIENGGLISCKFSEILKLFIKDVTLYAFVTDLSNDLHPAELNALLHITAQGSKILIIGTNEETDDEIKIPLLQQNLNNKNIKENKLLLRCKSPQRKDYEVGSSIIVHALSVSNPKRFPFSWYVFGFKLKDYIDSSNLGILSVNGHCMEIGKKLHMDAPTVRAALEHLTDHNMILYFKDILPDIVFSGIAIFSHIFTSLCAKLNSGRSLIDWHSSIVSKTAFLTEITSFTSGLNYITDNDFIILFQKLMILAPFDGDSNYILPFMLQSLDETRRQQIYANHLTSSNVPVLIKCPGPGSEFMSMLIACLLNQSWIIAKDHSGNPRCLYKNCVTFRLENYTITVTSWAEYIEICVETFKEKKISNYRHIASTILLILHRINVLRNGYNQFEFNIGFYCDCGKSNEQHTCTYSTKDHVLLCEKNRDKMFPSSSQMQWLGADVQEPLTITNAVNLLLQLSDKWIEVASFLGVPGAVIHTITVSSQKDNQVALRKAVEWWFKNCANPEWDQIHQILISVYGKKGTAFNFSRAIGTPPKGSTSQHGVPSTLDDKPLCKCGEQVVLLTVHKEGPNKGRKFYRCPHFQNKRDCEFFLWADEAMSSNSQMACQSGSVQKRREGAKRSDNIILCHCGKKTVKRKAKKGKHKEKWFYGCSKYVDEDNRGCNFFKLTQRCSNCKELGHDRRSCPKL